MIIIKKSSAKPVRVIMAAHVLPEYKRLFEEIGEGNIRKGIEDVAYTILKDREEQKKLKKEQTKK